MYKYFVSVFVIVFSIFGLNAQELKSPNEIKYIEGDYDYDKFDKLSVSLEEEKTLLEKANKIGLKLSTYLRLASLEKQ